MKKRVLQIITRSDWAGGQKVLYNIVYGLKKYFNDDFEVEVAFGKENGMIIPELEKIGVKYYIIDDLVREISPFKDMKAYFKIKNLIKRNKYDIVHTHSSKAGIIGRIAAKKEGVKNIVHTYHGFWGIEQFSGLKQKMLILSERIASKYANYLVFLCNRDKEKARLWKIGSEKQYKVVHNAIVPKESNRKGLLRKELNIPDNIKIIGNVARLDPQKNPIRFLEIAKKIINVRDDVVFVWIGGSIVNDFYGKIVQNYLSKYPILRERVYFLPFRKDAPDLMTDFDLFLLTSDSEGAPLVILEARENGIPIVSTDVGCVSEMIGEDFVSNDDYCLSKIVLDLLDKNINLESNKENYYKEFLVKYVSIYNDLY